jgi:hypothetical protein
VDSASVEREAEAAASAAAAEAQQINADVLAAEAEVSGPAIGQAGGLPAPEPAR